MNIETNEKPRGLLMQFRDLRPPMRIPWVQILSSPLGGDGEAPSCAVSSPAALHGRRSPGSFVDCWFENTKSWQMVVNEKSVLCEYKKVCTSGDHMILFKDILLLRGLWILNQRFAVRGMLHRRKAMGFKTRFWQLWHIHYGYEHGGSSNIILQRVEILLHSVGSCGPESPWMPP